MKRNTSSVASRFLARILRERHQDRGIEDAERARRMADEAEQGGEHEYHHEGQQFRRRLSGQQHIHAERGQAEIEHPDQDLYQRQRRIRQHHVDTLDTDLARAAEQPHQIEADDEEDGEADRLIDESRQPVDRAGGLRRDRHPKSEHEGIAEPEGEPGDEGDLGDVDDVKPIGGIDAKADGAAGEDGGAEIVPDGIAGEGGHRRDPVGHMPCTDGPQREEIVEGQRHIGAGDEQRAQRDVACRYRRRSPPPPGRGRCRAASETARSPRYTARPGLRQSRSRSSRPAHGRTAQGASSRSTSSVQRIDSQQPPCAQNTTVF